MSHLFSGSKVKTASSPKTQEHKRRNKDHFWGPSCFVFFLVGLLKGQREEKYNLVFFPFILLFLLTLMIGFSGGTWEVSILYVKGTRSTGFYKDCHNPLQWSKPPNPCPLFLNLVTRYNTAYNIKETKLGSSVTVFVFNGGLWGTNGKMSKFKFTASVWTQRKHILNIENSERWLSFHILKCRKAILYDSRIFMTSLEGE